MVGKNKIIVNSFYMIARQLKIMDMVRKPTPPATIVLVDKKKKRARLRKNDNIVKNIEEYE